MATLIRRRRHDEGKRKTRSKTRLDGVLVVVVAIGRVEEEAEEDGDEEDKETIDRVRETHT